jgi:hypothetical protein
MANDGILSTYTANANTFAFFWACSIDSWYDILAASPPDSNPSQLWSAPDLFWSWMLGTQLGDVVRLSPYAE